LASHQPKIKPAHLRAGLSNPNLLALKRSKHLRELAAKCAETNQGRKQE
jgi:hypothetical protein